MVYLMKKVIMFLLFFLFGGTITSYAVNLPVLMYHSVEPNGGIYSVTPEKFKADIESLTIAGYTPVSFEDVIAYVYDGKELPQKPVVITLDDGYENNYSNVFPIIKELNTKVEILAIAGFVDIGEFAMNWTEAKELNDSEYASVGCHTFNLHIGLPQRAGVVRNKNENFRQWEHLFRNDLSIARGLFSDYLGENPVTFAYPFGSFSAEAETVLREEGYLVTLTTEPGVNIIEQGDKESLHLMLRISMDGKMRSAAQEIQRYSHVNTSAAIRNCKNNLSLGKYVSREKALHSLYSKKFENTPANLEYIKYYSDLEHTSVTTKELFAKCVENNIISGFPDCTMRPDHYITRGEFAVLLARCTGYDGREASHYFADSLDWNDRELSWCAEKGYMVGYGESFGVNDFLTNEQLDIILERIK